MATSRYPSNSTTPVLNPNTQSSSSTSSSTQLQSTSSSSYQGLSREGLAATQQVIDRLLYGSKPVKETVFISEKGEEISKSSLIAKYGQLGGEAEWDLLMRRIAPIPGVPGLFRDNTGERLRASTRITPSKDSVLNGNPNRAAAIASLKTLLEGYDPSKASADSQAAVNYAIQKAMEANMPAIQRSVENAGTSGGSMSALLSQDLAARAGGEAAQLALQTKTNYGQISSNLANTLANLSSQKDPALEQLIDALRLTNRSTQDSNSKSSSITTENSSTVPIGISNQELFLPQSPSTSSAPRVSSLSSGSYTPASSSSGGSGSGFIFNNSTGDLTTFGSTDAETARRRLLAAS